MTMDEKRFKYSLVILFAVMLAFTGVNLWFTWIQTQNAEHASCPAWILIDKVYESGGGQKPTTPAGVAFAKVVHELAANCPKG